jgi:hypothetical protein
MKAKILAALLFSGTTITVSAFTSPDQADKNAAVLIATTAPALSQQVPATQSGKIDSYQMLADDPQVTNNPGEA